MNRGFADSTDWLDVKECPVCQKHFSVLYPSLWRYKRGTGKKFMYFCRYSCMKEYDGRKEARKVKKVTLEEKKKAVSIALEGGNPIDYLKTLGVTNLTTSWTTIRKYYEKKDPETFKKLPVSYGKTAKATNQDLDPAENAEADQETEAPEDDFAPVEESRYNWEPFVYETSAIRIKDLGEFYHDRKFNAIDWRAPDGAETSLSPDGWRNLHDAIPDMLSVLGAVK